MSNVVDQQTLYNRLSKNNCNNLINQIVNFTKNVINTYNALTKTKTDIFVKLSKSLLTKKELWILKKYNKTNRRVVIAAEIIEKTIKLRDKTNKIFLFSVFVKVTTVFRLISIIMIFDFLLFVFVFLFVFEFFLFTFEFFSFTFEFLLFTFDFLLFFSSSLTSASIFLISVFAVVSNKKKNDRFKNSKNVFKSKLLLSFTNFFLFSLSRNFTLFFVTTRLKREFKKIKMWKQVF